MNAKMQIDREALSRHYASMSDEELLALEREELTEVAQKCYDHEIERRNLAELPKEDSDESFDLSETHGVHDEPDWIETAAIACSFTAHPGSVVAPEAAQACDALRAAKIPCQMNELSPDPSDENAPRYAEYQVLVPGALSLKAASILDKEIFNPQQEADWRAHLAALSDDDLGVLSPAIICAGFLDRAARLKRAYEDEVARRGGR